MKKDIERYRGMPALYIAMKQCEERERHREALGNFLLPPKKDDKKGFDLFFVPPPEKRLRHSPDAGLDSDRKVRGV